MYKSSISFVRFISKYFFFGNSTLKGIFYFYLFLIIIFFLQYCIGFAIHQHASATAAASRIFILNCIYLFLAVLDLHCCVRAFSACGKQGLLSSCGAWAS